MSNVIVDKQNALEIILKGRTEIRYEGMKKPHIKRKV
jgi:hypothetical protein